MSELADKYRSAAVARVQSGEGRASEAVRRATFANQNLPEGARGLLDKVTKHAYKVTDEDIAAAKAAGLSEDELFELVVCAAMGQATRQLDGAMAALDAATQEKP